MDGNRIYTQKKKVIKKIYIYIYINILNILIIYTFKVEWDQTVETSKIHSYLITSLGQEKWVKWDEEFLLSLIFVTHFHICK